MSINVTYYRLPAAERKNVTNSQPVWDLFRKSVWKAYQDSFKHAMAAMDEVSSSREEKFAKFGSVLREKRDPRQFDMQKDWHTMGYLITGQAEIVEKHMDNDPLHNVNFGGHQTAVTTGYGAVQYFDTPLVTQSVTALRGVDREAFSRRFDPARMEELEIYAAPDEGELDGYLKVLEDFTAFFEAAAAAKEDVIRFAT